MFLEITHQYDNDILPFIRNGVVIDTSTFWVFIEGLIDTRISKKDTKNLPDFRNLLNLLDLIKVKKWDRFFITPHILTEVCNKLRNKCSKWENYKDIVDEIIPILKDIDERTIEKQDIIDRIDNKNPKVEVGDISISVVAEQFIKDKKRIAILASDTKLNKGFQDHPRVMVLDYRSLALNSL